MNKTKNIPQFYAIVWTLQRLSVSIQDDCQVASVSTDLWRQKNVLLLLLLLLFQLLLLLLVHNNEQDQNLIFSIQGEANTTSTLQMFQIANDINHNYSDTRQTASNRCILQHNNPLQCEMTSATTCIIVLLKSQCHHTYHKCLKSKHKLKFGCMTPSSVSSAR